MYREHFRPSEQQDRPLAMLCLPAVPADTVDEAKHISTTSYQRILSLFRGQPLWLKPPVDSMDGLWSPAEEAGVRDFLGLQVLGDEDAITERLQQILATVEVDELMFTVDLYDPAQRRRALDILARVRDRL